ncbi:TonB-dependent receptor [Novosphingobium endophyticum]|uniref:TonB-dependent receptor n=1 Tax=Novosphingobium endophyticum TaxID=1955250 RepID=A0A916X3V2_9SPHN|nr:TonB-dependent receptor [Novosphingobium endophyticum]GGB94836.1 TonB-dependent receptor [Novosphingobium endophyticum]
MRKSTLLAAPVLSVVSLGTFAAPAIAQDAGPVEQSNDAGLGEIVVTAQRRAESLQNAAIAISAVSGDALVQQGVTDPAGLTGAVPALEVSTGTGGKSLFYLRGVGNFSGNSLSDGAIAFNFNDVYIARAQGTGGFFHDLERVEVLKGPQGTLYGRNATGGAINVIPAAPKLGEFGGHISGEYGNYDHMRVEGAVNAPLGDNGAIRLSAMRVKHDGYLSDGTDDQDDFSARLGMRAELTPTLDVTVTGDYFRKRGKGGGATIISDTGGRFDIDDRVGLSDPRAQAVYEQDTFVFTAGSFLTGLPDVSDVDINNWGVSATINWDTPAGELTVIPAYRETDSKSVTIQPGFYISEDARSQQFSMEARLASDDTNTFSYLLGAYYIDEDGDVPLFRTNAQYNAALQNYEYQTESYAFFGRLNFRATDKLTLSLGGRYTKEKKAFQGLYRGQNRFCVTETFSFGLTCPGAPPIPFNDTLPLAFANLESVGLVPFPLAGGIAAYENGFDPDRFLVQVYNEISNNSSNSFNKFTYRLAADYQVTPDNLIYASYETGFKSGGFFFSPTQNTYSPETIQAFTLGSKNSFMGNRIRLNVEAFHWIYKDQQISHLGSALDPDTQQSVIIFPTENVGKATFTGGEVELEALVTDTTRLGAQVQYLDAKYDEFVYNVPANSPPQTGCATAPSGGGATIALDCSGFRPPNAPKWVIRLTGEQRVPLGNGGEFVFNASGNFQSKTLTGLEFLPVETQGSYWNVDAALTYNAPNDRFYIGGYVRNAFNKTVFTNSFPPPLTNGLFVAALRSPRTYGIRAGFNF